jgi:nucleoside-diphosphate-sugar epimerase
MKARTVCVTGASGFIGRALVRQLGRDGWRVRAATRSAASGFGPWAGVVPGMQLAPDTDWQPALQGADAVVHAAARVHRMRDGAADPLAEFRAINVDGSMNLARQAVAAGVRRFVFLSTVGVHGAQTHGRAFSTNDPVAPHSDYARSKHEAEQALRALATSSGMELVILRPPLVYGPAAPGNFGLLLSWLRRGLPLPLASVDNRRSLVGLDNLLDLVGLCLIHPAAANQVFMAADGEDISTPELLRRLGQALGRPARLFPVPLVMLRAGARLAGRSGMFTQLCGSLQVDIGATRERLGWNPPFSLGQGLARAARAGDNSDEASA